ncbi:MAG: RagB/SusD family nutrient uptake outer membrane protein [Cytophagales bacterium]|nr:RagB/SusD family nutrient uptake outer membrane protein [Cytophagales bacterium]
MNASVRILLSATALLIGSQACNPSEFLDQPPQAQEVSPTFFATSEGAVKATNAVYWQLRQWPTHVFAFIAISSFTSDDADKGSEPGDAIFMNDFDNFTTLTPTNFILNDFWTGQYDGINKANQVIERVPAIEMDDTLKNRLIAEARTLRAYFYFNLVRAFGGVPRITQAPKAEDRPQPRATAAEIYQLIEQDLTAAIPNLPEKSAYAGTELGRVTKGAAKGWLAKASMYQGKWADVLRLTDEIIASGEYDLSTPYNVIFTEAGENGRESVFEVQAAALPQCGGGSQYAEVQSVRGQLGWGFNTPSEDLLTNGYEPGDPRRQLTILSRGETLPDGFAVAASAPNAQYNQKAYIEQSAPRSPCGIGDGGKNIRLLRYADILLMNAEAANQLGNTAKALASLNAVRARARGNTPNVLPDVTFQSQEQLRAAIWRERRAELAMEHDRFWDLVRQGRAGQVLRAVGKTGFVDGKHELMPIPQTQIDASGGVLTQNPNY